MIFLELSKMQQMQFNVQGVEINLLRIEDIDSRTFEDTQHVIQERASKYTNMKMIKTRKITSKSDRLLHSTSQ